MGSVIKAAEAPLGTSTSLAAARSIANTDGDWSPSHWWIVDLDVRGFVADTNVIPRPSLPTQSRLLAGGLRIPLHVQVDWSFVSIPIACAVFSGGSTRGRLVLDAMPQRLFVCADRVELSIVGPESLRLFDPPSGPETSTDPATVSPATVYGLFTAAIWPLAFPGSGGHSNSCTLRRRVGSRERVTARVPIPAGARTLQIYDDSGSGSPWEWTFGADAGAPVVGRIPTTGGISSIVTVPFATHVGPREEIDVVRDVLLVFGVEL